MFGKKKQQNEAEAPQTEQQGKRHGLALPHVDGTAVRRSLHAAGFQHGSYSAGLTALVLAILIVVNLLVGSLPTNTRMLDMTSNSLFEIGDTTRTAMAELDRDVTITIVAQPDTLDTRIQRLIDEYAALSSHISVETVDPVLHPSEAQALDAEDGMVVVSCEETGETRNILFGEIITHTYSMYSYDAVEDSFDGEGQLTSAIVNVSSPTDHVVYLTEGHGESSLGSTIQDALTKANLQTQTVNLVVDGGIPDDCSLLIVNAPQKDLDATETQAIQEFMDAGGHVMILLGQTQNAQPNLDALLKTYGMQRQTGYIADTERYYSSPYDIFPELYAGTVVSQDLTSDALILIYNAVGMVKTDPANENVTLSTVMQTGSNGYLVTEDSQTQGQYLLGAVATQEVTEETADTGEEDQQADAGTTEDTGETDADAEEQAETKVATLCVLPATLIDDSILGQFSNLSNQDLFMSAVTSNFDDISNISIPAKSLTTSYNLITGAGAWGMLFIAIIPLAVLGGGLVHWLRRRRRV